MSQLLSAVPSFADGTADYSARRSHHTSSDCNHAPSVEHRRSCKRTNIPIEPEALGCAVIWNHRPTLSFTKSQETCENEYNYNIDSCKKRFPGNTNTAKQDRAQCYSNAMRAYADCLKGAD